MSTVGEAGRSEASWRVDPAWTLVVWAVVRRLFPYLVEATLIPTAMYYAGLVTFGQFWGILAAATCTYVSVSRRLVRRQPVPGLLVVASVGISVRVGMYLANESSFVYSHDAPRCLMKPFIRSSLVEIG